MLRRYGLQYAFLLLDAVKWALWFERTYPAAAGAYQKPYAANTRPTNNMYRQSADGERSLTLEAISTSVAVGKLWTCGIRSSELPGRQPSLPLHSTAVGKVSPAIDSRVWLRFRFVAMKLSGCCHSVKVTKPVSTQDCFTDSILRQHYLHHELNRIDIFRAFLEQLLLPFIWFATMHTWFRTPFGEDGPEQCSPGHRPEFWTERPSSQQATSIGSALPLLEQIMFEIMPRSQ